MALRVVRRDRHLAMFPVLSGLALLLVVFAALHTSIRLTSTGRPGVHSNLIEAAVVIVAYFVCFFVIIFFNTALVSAVKRSFDGRVTSVRAGVRDALRRFWPVLAWSIVAAFVYFILSFLHAITRRNWLASAFVRALTLAWVVVAYFAIPVIAEKGHGPVRTIRESTRLIKRAWGEALAGNVVIWGFFFVAGALAVVGFVVVNLYVQELWLRLLGFTAAGLWLLTVVVLYFTVNQVLNTALYRYATGGRMGLVTREEAREFFDPGEGILRDGPDRSVRT